MADVELQISPDDVIDSLRMQISNYARDLALQSAGTKCAVRQRDEALKQVANRDEKIASLVATLAKGSEPSPNPSVENSDGRPLAA